MQVICLRPEWYRRKINTRNGRCRYWWRFYKIREKMMESMGLPRGANWTGHQAQHIIPVEMANHPVLQRNGMDLDDASNGLFLRTPADDISAMV